MAYPKVRNFRGAWLDLVTYDLVLELAFLAGDIYVNPIDGCGSWQGATVQDADTGRVFTLPLVDKSAGTHTREGAFDIDCSRLSTTEARRLETIGRSLGCADWFRLAVSPYTGKSYGWQPHLHGLRIGADLSSSADAQVQDYYDGWDGLAVPHRDTGSRAYVGMTWAKYKEANVTNEQMQTLIREIRAVPGATWNVSLTVDPDGEGPREPNTSPAKSYLMMANVFANKAMYNTDTVEATMATLRSEVAAGDPDVDKALDDIEAQLVGLVQKVDALAPKA